MEVLELYVRMKYEKVVDLALRDARDDDGSHAPGQ